MRKAKLNKHENSRKRFISIRTRLIASFLVTAIPILLLGVFSYQSAVSSISETAQKTSVETIKQVDKYLEMTLGNIDAVSRHIMSDTDYTNYLFTVNQDDADADRDTYQSSLTASLNNYAYTNDYIQSIILLLKNNKSISNDQAIPANGYERVENTELIKQVKDKKGSPLWVGNLDELNEILPTSSGKNAVSLMRQARSGNEECGVLIINVKSELVADALADVNLGDGSELHLISSDNRDIAYVVKNDWNHVLDTTQPENQIHGTEFYQTIKNDIAKDGAMTIQYKGREHFALYSKIASTGYTLVVLVPTANFTASAGAIERITTLFTLFAGVIAIAMGLLLAFRMGRTIRRIIDASKKVIDGDLTIQFASKRRDELGILSESLNQMIAHMRELIKDSARTSEKVGEAAKTVAVTSAQVAQASNEVTGTIQEISGGATAQADESERGVTKMQELAMNIQAVSEGAKVIDEYSNQTIALTREGLASVEELEDKSRQTTEFIQAIKADTHVLDENSQTIRNIVKVIHNIADQTNLLSLNAAIEAARAGEWGKGFAVVAEEIRKLADQSTAATHEITQIINRTLNQTARVVEWAESSENILNSQNEAVRAVSEVFGRITQSMDRLAGQLEKISTGIGQMDHNKDQALAAIHSISSVAEQIAASTQEVAASTEEQMSAIEELANYAKVLEDTAIQLDKSIKRFKV